MKNVMIAGLALVAASVAHADGFVCQTQNGAMNLQVYDYTQAAQGTRSPAILVLSDSQASAGFKTIARFTNVKGTLTHSGSTYFANVDLRFSDQSNKTALVGGKVLLEDTDTIQVSIAYNFNEPVKAGEFLPGVLLINTREGEQINMGLACQRYLKN